MTKLIGYVLRRHGPKAIPDLFRHSSSRLQMFNLCEWESKSRFTLGDILCDYARHHQSLEQLPELKLGLEMAEMHNTLVIMDDLRRLFRPVPLPRRDTFFDELMSAGGQLAGLRQARRLIDAPEVMRAVLRMSGESGPYAVKKPLRRGLSRGRRFKARRIAQTAKARKASARARREQALSHAREIARVRDELREDGQRATLAAIAEAANAKGMRTARGNPWSSSSVSRALKRLEEEEEEKEEDVAEETAAA